LPPPLPFSLRVAKEQQIDGASRVRETKTRIYGFLRLRDDRLVLEWLGQRETVETGMARIQTTKESIPQTSVEIRLDQVVSIASGGRIFRPRIVLRTSDLETTSRIPSAEHGKITLWLEREDLPAAAQLVAQIRSHLAGR
jgi:hypothetical protein